MDGYHELDSIVAFADCGDKLEIKLADDLSLECSGPFVSSVPRGSENIILKSWHVMRDILQRRDIDMPPVVVNLQKNLPVASGMGGGSSNAAAMVRAMSRLVGQDLTAAEVITLSRTLGADVPVCFYQRSARMEGIGETLSALTVELPHAIVLVNPGQTCATADVFGKLGLARGQSHGNALDPGNLPLWRNDLTVSAVCVEPAIAQVLKALQEEPMFIKVSMSGSGATCFGLCRSIAEANAAAARLAVKNPDWWIKSAQLL